MDKRKTGIALFITLMVIASIMSIIAVSFSYLEKVQKDAGATSALIQANILHGNTIEKLKQIFPSGKDNGQKFALFYNMPIPINEEKSGFSLTIICQALMIGAPINWLNADDTPNDSAKSTLIKDVLAQIAILYDVEDPVGLEEILLQAITSKRLQSDDYELRLKRQKDIISKEQFDRLIANYAFKYDDQKALNIPWEKYFSFIKVDAKTRIDGNYLSPEFISAAFDMPIEIVQDSWIIGESTLSTFLSENGISTPIDNKIYSKQALNAMHCEQIFAYKERQYSFKFNYIEGRSSNFEFNGQE